MNQKNISKSVITLIGCWQKLRDCTVSLFLYDKALALVASTKYLGVIVDQHLTCVIDQHLTFVIVDQHLTCVIVDQHLTLKIHVGYSE